MVPCPACPMGPRPFPPHLLLLPRGLLQIILGRSAFLRRFGTEKKIPRRELLPFDHAEHPPLLHVHCRSVHFLSFLRCLQSPLVCGRHGWRKIRDRGWDPCPDAKRRPSWRV